MRKPKELFLSRHDKDQKAIVSHGEILLFIDYRKITVKNAARLGKWLIKASEYLKNRKEKRVIGGVIL
jgi:hypothetical protein